MKGIYLASYKANHQNYDIVYQDINGERDIGGDMLGIDLSFYDFIIATPPCNYWSRANYRRETSDYSQKTKHLLPDIIDKLIKLNKPFIVENVRNYKLFNEYDLFNKDCFIYEIGRHTYWTNIVFNGSNIKQKNDNIHNISSKDRQGGFNVYNVIEYWLDIVNKEYNVKSEMPSISLYQYYKNKEKKVKENEINL